MINTCYEEVISPKSKQSPVASETFSLNHRQEDDEERGDKDWSFEQVDDHRIPVTSRLGPAADKDAFFPSQTHPIPDNNISSSSTNLTTSSNKKRAAHSFTEEGEELEDSREGSVRNDRPSSEFRQSDPQSRPSSSSRRGGRYDEGRVEEEFPKVRFRCIVTAKEGAIIIGAKGRNINVIKEMGVYIKVSPFIPHFQERVVTMSGPLDRLGDAIYYMAERMMEPYTGSQRDGRGDDGPKDIISVRALVPAAKMGYLIGKGGSRIKELQISSGAEIYSEEQLLGHSTEKSVVVRGDARAIQIAIYTIVSIVGTDEIISKLPPQVLFEPGQHPYPYAEARASSYMHQPVPPHHQLSHRDSYWQAPVHPQDYPPSSAAYPSSVYQQQYPSFPVHSGAQVMQEIEIPDEFAAKIIGKGGANAKELKHRTGSDIKIYDRQPGKSDRLVQVMGTYQGNEMLIGMIWDRIASEQKRRGYSGSRDRSCQPYSVPSRAMTYPAHPTLYPEASAASHLRADSRGSRGGWSAKSNSTLAQHSSREPY